MTLVPLLLPSVALAGDVTHKIPSNPANPIPADLRLLDGGALVFDLPDGTTPRITSPVASVCTGTASDGGLSFTVSSCPPAFRFEPLDLTLADAGGVTTVKLAAIDATTGVVDGNEPASWTLDPAADKGSVYWFLEDGSGWTRQDAGLANATRVLWKAGGKQYVGTPSTETGTGSERGDAPPTCARVPPSGGFLVVVESHGKGWTPRFYDDRPTPSGGTATVILRPNTPVTVCVEHGADLAVDITLSGSRGLSVPNVKDLSGRVTAQAPEIAGGTTTTEQFAPRRPGSVDVAIQVDDGAPRVVAELEVAEAIAGVVRAGIAVGTVVEGGFDVVTAPGADQAEIVSTTFGAVSPELVLGFAPFLDRGGRVYEVGTPQQVAPYVALGVVSDSAQGTTFSVLKSVYVGAELELMRSSSIAATVVAKRATRLVEPLQVGGPAATDADLATRSGYELGFALVFNLSPEFVEIARGGQSKE